MYPAASALFKPDMKISLIRLTRTHSLRGMHCVTSLAAELGLSSVRRCWSVVGFPQAVLHPSSGLGSGRGPSLHGNYPASSLLWPPPTPDLADRRLWFPVSR